MMFNNPKSCHQVDFKPTSSTSIYLMCSYNFYFVIGFLNARGLFKVDMLKVQFSKTSRASWVICIECLLIGTTCGGGGISNMLE